MKEPVQIYEVGLRDGLQNEAAFVPTEDKLRLAAMLADAGLKRIELTSFVSPKWIPQLADHARLCSEIEHRPGVRYSALVPNQRGLEGALKGHLDELAVFMSASEAHSKKNINKSIAEALEVLRPVVRDGKAAGLFVRGYLSTVFGCPYEGPADVGVVHQLVLQLFEMGVDEVSLGDTIGVAHPGLVRGLLKALAPDVPFERLALHMHDTRGTALANVLAGLDLGIRCFDTAFGGLGGCPYAPGASGNLATEDLVYMLNGMGFDTGIDLDALVKASLAVTPLVSRSLPSKVLQSMLSRCDLSGTDAEC